MQLKIKRCRGYGDHEPHDGYIFAKGLCKYAYGLMQAFKAREKQKSRPHAIAKSKARIQKPLSTKPTVKHIERKTKERKAMKKYWQSKSDEMDLIRCEETQKVVGRKDEFNPALVCHILGKGADTTQRDNIENYVILEYSLHDTLDARLDIDPNSKNHISKKLPNTWERITAVKTKLKLESC